jgi:hypothetical protein
MNFFVVSLIGYLSGDTAMSQADLLESLLAPLRAAFHAKRRERVTLAEQISRSLEAYVRAVDTTILQQLGKAHDIGVTMAGDSPDRLAAELLRLVQSLPELQTNTATASATSSTHPDPPQKPPSQRDSAAVTGTDAASRSPLYSQFEHTPLVIVGGPPHLERLSWLPDDMKTRVEWVDTTRQGTHAIGNLERRIRDNRIGAMVILEGLVQHRHTDPLVSAARAVGLPHAFAGKGGRSALAQTIEELFRRLLVVKGPSAVRT